MKKIILLAVFLLSCFFLQSCLENNISPPFTGELNEAAELLFYFESNGDYANSLLAPSLVNAEEVFTNISSYLIIDTRESTVFGNGHIEGSINILSDSLYDYIENINPGNYQKIILVCANGQSSSYFTCLLRLAGYNNIYSLNYGMASWNPFFADEWLNAIGDAPNISTYTNNDFPKNSLTDLPSISFENPDATLKERVNKRIEKITEEGLFSTANLPPASDTYLICYGNMRLYYARRFVIYEGLGHPPGAIYYIISPDSELRSNKFLQTLPTDKEIVIYDYNGLWSACMTAYLRVLGYNVRSLLFGGNQLFYSRMIEDPDLQEFAFTNSEINNFPYISTE